MRKIASLTIFFLLLTANIVFAGDYKYKHRDTATRYGSHYDWKSDNYYTWREDFSGGTKVRGYNFNTGSQWNTTIEKDGSMRGVDSNMNYWKYDKKNDTYINFGTGDMRINGVDF